MWKFVTRGIRESLERRACRTNVYSQTSQDVNSKNEVKTSLTCNHKFLGPSFSFCNKQLCGSTKVGGTKDKSHDSKWNAKYTWSDAIGWTGVLALGWVVCQTLCLRRRFFGNDKTESWKPKLSKVPEVPVSKLFHQIQNLKPKHFLPIVNCVGTSKIYAQENNDTKWETDKPFGPVTIEEALKEATDEFANTHKLVMAEFELHYGLKALEEKRYKDAIKHFTTGASLSSASSMFNLGLCYELGLGTLVDYRKAAKYYNDAAVQGHADATYNMGVYHAQGRGGFPINIDIARSYFIKAAEMGHSDAQHALNLEKHYHNSKQTESNKVLLDECKNVLKSTQKNENMNHILKELINYNNTLYTQSQPEFLENSGSTQTKVEHKNPTELMLDMLGIYKSNVIPMSVESNNCGVPC